MPALFHIDLNLIDEYDPFLSDVLKWTSILFTLHIFKVMNGSELFDFDFFQNVLIAIIGLALYHLVIKKTIQFIYADDSAEGFSGTLRLFRKKEKSSTKGNKKRRQKKRLPSHRQ